MAEAGKEIELAAPSDAITSIAFHPTDPARLLCSSWDSTIRVYNLNSPSESQTFTPSRAPVFDACWGPGSKVYSGGLDRTVVETDLETGTYRVVGTHNDAVKCVKWLESANCLVSASWDSTLRIHDPRSSSPSSLILPIPSKAFSLDVAGDFLVLAMANRQVSIYTLSQLGSAFSSRDTTKAMEPVQKRENSLKFMTRCVRAMPNGKGYASSSIEGRVAVEYFDESKESQKGHFAFKCHRATVDGVDTVYPVNALAFHPIHGTFATGGGDSLVSIWDPLAKKRLRQYPKYPTSISSLSFNSDGTKLAVACALIEEEQGSQVQGENKLIIRNVGDEVKPKAKS